MKNQLLTLTFILLAMSSAIAQSTHTVSQTGGRDFETIQEAVNAATSGDTIKIYAGNYVEQITLSKTIHLRALENKEEVILSGEIKFNTGSDGSSVLGFMINKITFQTTSIEDVVLAINEIEQAFTTGRNTLLKSNIFNATVSVYYNSIAKDNEGPGMTVSSSYAVNNILTSIITAYAGAVIYKNECSHISVQGSNVNILANTANYIRTESNCYEVKIIGNKLENPGSYGISCRATNTATYGIVIANNLIQNCAKGIEFQYGLNSINKPTIGAEVKNNVFYNIDLWLVANSYSFYNASSIVCTNNIGVNYGSTAFALTGVSNDLHTHNLLFNGTEFTSGTGNINGQDPLFTDPANGDFSLRSGSPAINAGNPNFRFLDIDNTRNDMGIYGGPETWANYEGNDALIFNMLVGPSSVTEGEDITIKATGMSSGQ
ncbi:MAG: hypothetical protein RIC03_06135 [Cyclobacteriaceae bacterium]